MGRLAKQKRQLIEQANRRILKESENTDWSTKNIRYDLNEQAADTQDITGPIALAGALHDCYVYRYNPESKNIQKYKSTGGKDYLYKYVEGDKWGNSSDRQNAKFKKALELLNSEYQGGVFKVKPWEGVENAVGSISAAMTAIKKEYCSTGAKGDKVVKDDETTKDWPKEFSCVTGEGFESKTNEDGTITYVSNKGNTYFSDGKAKTRDGGDWFYKCQDGRAIATKGAGKEKEDDIGSKEEETPVGGSNKFLGPDAEFIFSQVTSFNINKNEMKKIHDVVKKYEKDGSICDLIAKYAEVASKKKGSLGQTPDTWKSGMLNHIAGIAFWDGNEHRKGVKDMIKKANCK